ncbi:D-serine ammonia-lyase [Heyndrickxia sporothermodurans]|uniref:Probable D-serine dehydratase n=1 Tax=Heyndrickxia sporothermodurans TaxID=46224 RepID=A0AB37HF04_9BACI|nr:D-serine ammonia-lyase [Heyndrickxia sporothermodurans]MBL5766725.1 D-serine ammonia-lyase [Heyndrickxia sporothermodurans]MBL5770352.1 D-serine ammonia-lyase [Heyndrickxia sporothermodurans]MBL5774042.1 D-serine ammonia-lyase [Heyndrickxia sporothermodurans]MBL5777677.1 D-serine ammonia-lyase [Heyndrickxia sporothermodurans]MBL5780937.1 D-serine ammonia-lyase [Heyndrickxia sporothermodurans]
MGKIAGKTVEEWIKNYPLIKQMISTEEVFWTNPKYGTFEEAMKHIYLSEKDVKEAEQRLQRFSSYIAQVFPETKEMNGIIESPTVEIPHMQKKLESKMKKIEGRFLLKCDSHLAISGSIKARGGIYEVLKHAEDLAIEANMLTFNDDYSMINSERFRKFYSQYSIVVGSTGNLGLSIGIMSAKLGFNVTVHMSADAKQWKKDLLRSKGVNVVEHPSDYSKAVEEGRKQAELDPNGYFIDDENSTTLFLGYAVAASRLKKQFEEMDIKVDEEHPLFVYLPCGVGGGPGGVAFGLKLVFKDYVHCFFAEPTHSPCMLLGLMTEQHDKISVQEFGIDNVTDADGLAVGRPSGFVGKTLENLISGVYTVSDEQLYSLLSTLVDTEDIYLEPSALAGVAGPIRLFNDHSGQKYTEDQSVAGKMHNATHLAWATGGSMVPKEVMNAYYQRGLQFQLGK